MLGLKFPAAIVVVHLLATSVYSIVHDPLAAPIDILIAFCPVAYMTVLPVSFATVGIATRLKLKPVGAVFVTALVA